MDASIYNKQQMTIANLEDVKKALNGSQIPRGVLPKEVDLLMGIDID